MVTKEKIDTNPMAVNILKLQRYNFGFFSLEEVIFFEYLIVKAKGFGFKEFYHSDSTIAAETGIKRTRLGRVIKRFTGLGIIRVEVKGFPLVKHFTVDFENVVRLLPKIYNLSSAKYQNADFGKLCDDFYKLLAETSKEKHINKKNKKEECQARPGQPGNALHGVSDDEKAIKLINSLSDEFNKRRERYNKTSREKRYLETGLAYNAKNIASLKKLLQLQSEKAVRNSFIAYCDKIMEGEETPSRILPLFLSDYRGDFQVFNRYLEVYNAGYSVSL